MATDWTEQAEVIIKNWTGAQRKMWERWLEAMQNIEYASPAADVWEQTVDNWNASVKKALEAQVMWTQFWADSVHSRTGTPKQVTDWSQQLLGMMKQWTNTQIHLSERWFETIKKSTPATVARAWDQEEAQKVVQDWQEATQKSLEAQMSWVRFWLATQAQPGGAAEPAIPADTPPVSQVDAGAPGSEVSVPPQPALADAPATPPESSVPPTSQVEAGTHAGEVRMAPPESVPPTSQVDAGTATGGAGEEPKPKPPRKPRKSRKKTESGE